MPTTFPDASRSPASRDFHDGARRLGPYETAYDVRRGYDDPGVEASPASRAAPEPVWIGRRRDGASEP